jgi:hypothetical protein
MCSTEAEQDTHSSQGVAVPLDVASEKCIQTLTFRVWFEIDRERFSKFEFEFDVTLQIRFAHSEQVKPK